MLEIGLEDLDAAFERLERELAETVRGVSVEIWNSTLEQTPQYFGRMVASYTYSLNTPRFNDRSADLTPDFPEGADEEVMKKAIRSKGHGEAIAIAKLANLGNDYGFKLGDTVWITNGVDHGEGPYAGDIEAGNIPLRAVNRPGRALGRAVDRATNLYGVDVSPGRVPRLRSLGIGV